MTPKVLTFFKAFFVVFHYFCGFKIQTKKFQDGGTSYPERFLLKKTERFYWKSLRKKLFKRFKRCDHPENSTRRLLGRARCDVLCLKRPKSYLENVRKSIFWRFYSFKNIRQILTLFESSTAEQTTLRRPCRTLCIEKCLKITAKEQKIQRLTITSRFVEMRFVGKNVSMPPTTPKNSISRPLQEFSVHFP